jgi:hypothetical protein
MTFADSPETARREISFFFPDFFAADRNLAESAVSKPEYRSL